MKSCIMYSFSTIPMMTKSTLGEECRQFNTGIGTINYMCTNYECTRSWIRKSPLFVSTLEPFHASKVLWFHMLIPVLLLLRWANATFFMSKSTIPLFPKMGIGTYTNEYSYMIALCISCMHYNTANFRDKFTRFIEFLSILYSIWIFIIKWK